MNPSTTLTLCWYEGQQRLFKQKYLKWSHWPSPFHWAWGSHNVMGSPSVVMSSSHRPLRSPKHARNQPTCQPVLSAPQIPGNSLLCWRKGLKRAILEVTPAPVPSWQPPHHQLHPRPTPTTAGPDPPCISFSLEMHSKKGVFPRAWIQPFSCPSL